MFRDRNINSFPKCKGRVCTPALTGGVQHLGASWRHVKALGNDPLRKVLWLESKWRAGKILSFQKLTIYRVQ